MVHYRRTAVAVLTLAFAAGAMGQNLRMGTRYHLIDKEVQSVTTRFTNVEITTARLTDGRLETRVRTSDGRPAGAPLLSQPEQVRLVAEAKNGAPRSVIEVDLQPLDAVNAARYRSWKRGKAMVRTPFDETPPELIGSEGPVEMADAAGDIVSVTTRSGDLEAFSRIGGRGTVDNRELPAFTSVLRQEQDVIAVMAWFPISQTLVFQMKWSREPRSLSAADMPKGWTFQPNMAWANIQLLSFARFAESQAREKRTERFAPIANDSPGCDGLHWLDGTTLRACCDVHDQCYYKDDPACTYVSWWFRGGWSCTQCNIDAVLCMAAQFWGCEYTGRCVLYPVYDWDPGQPNCYIGWGCYCPAWCAGCEIVSWLWC